jgi:hypothetical protein
VDGVEAADATKLGRTARWLLLFCTLFGLATMHTLGHAGMQMDSHAHRVVMPSAEASLGAGGTSLAMHIVEAMTAPCPYDHCSGGHGTGGMDPWSVCVAVLGGLAMAVLLISLLLGRRNGSARPHDGSAGHAPASRAPPGWQHQGLRVASLAVLRI